MECVLSVYMAIEYIGMKSPGGRFQRSPGAIVEEYIFDNSYKTRKIRNDSGRKKLLKWTMIDILLIDLVIC